MPQKELKGGLTVSPGESTEGCKRRLKFRKWQCVGESGRIAPVCAAHPRPISTQRHLGNDHPTMNLPRLHFKVHHHPERFRPSLVAGPAMLGTRCAACPCRRLL